MQTWGVAPTRMSDRAEADQLAGRAARDLRQSELLAGLNDAQMHAVARTARMLEVKRGGRIYTLGDPCAHLFIVKTGVVKISTVGGDGREIVLEFLHRGALFGEADLVDEAPRDHTAHAHEDVVVYAMQREPLRSLIRESPELGYQIARLMALRIRCFRARVEPLLCRTAQARVAHTLLALAMQHSVTDGDGILIPLRLSQSDLAKLAGLTRETVNIVLRDFHSRGLVEAGRRSIRLKDPETLRSAG